MRCNPVSHVTRLADVDHFPRTKNRIDACTLLELLRGIRTIKVISSEPDHLLPPGDRLATYERLLSS